MTTSARSRRATAAEILDGGEVTGHAGGSGSEGRRTCAGRRQDPEHPVVRLDRCPDAVAVGRGDPEGTLGVEDDGAQPAVLPPEELLGVAHDGARSVEWVGL